MHGPIEQVLEIRRGFRHEVHLHQVQAGLDRHREPQRFDHFLVAVVSDIGAGSTSDTTAGEFRSTNRAGPDLDVVEAHFNLMRLGRDAFESARDSRLSRPHLDQVVAVGRKVVAERHAAARSEWQIVADPFRLIAVGWHVDRFRCRKSSRPPQRHLTDFRRGSEISLGQRRRERQRVGVVVEPVARDVCRQHRRGVDFDGEQIADGVRIFPAVQTLQRGPPGIHMFGSLAIELGLEPGDQARRGGLIRPCASDRRHRPRPDLANDLFPFLGVRTHVCQIQRVEREPARLQALVVAGGAVFGENGLLRLPIAGDRLLITVGRRRPLLGSGRVVSDGND